MTMDKSTEIPLKTVVFLVTEDWFFASHFHARGLAAKAAGWRVVLITHDNAATAHIRASGIEVIPVNFVRRRLNPFAEFFFALKLMRLYRRIKPDVVHHVALKPIIIGGLAARLAGTRHLVNAPVGLGFIFSSEKLLARVLRPFVTFALRITLSPPGAIVVFENHDDLMMLSNAGMVRKTAARLIQGAGVDMTLFYPVPEPPGPVRVLLVARMIREKGVADFIEAARLLRGQAEFVLVGAPDPGNPNTITEAELRRWEAEGLVRWLGARHDVADLLRGAHIACQPSTYREGLPKSALEAMASGKPLVASNVPGCREAVVDGQTGLLVPPHDPTALAEALARLIHTPSLRARLGSAARIRVEQNFSDPIICAQTLLIYTELLQHKNLV